jgi:hypothetical protein
VSYTSSSDGRSQLYVLVRFNSWGPNQAFQISKEEMGNVGKNKQDLYRKSSTLRNSLPLEIW